MHYFWQFKDHYSRIKHGNYLKGRKCLWRKFFQNSFLRFRTSKPTKIADFIFAIFSFQKNCRSLFTTIYIVGFCVSFVMFLKTYYDLLYKINQPISFSLKRPACNFAWNGISSEGWLKPNASLTKV